MSLSWADLGGYWYDVRMIELKNKRVLVMGLGRFGGGAGVARFLATEGAEVRVTDMLGAGELAESVAGLEGLGIDFVLGEHRVEDFGAWADVVVVNPAVKPAGNKFLDAARENGVVMTSEIGLLVERLPGRKRTVGVTGSNGKSTTVAMLGHVLGECLNEGEQVWVGGNIGGSLLGKLVEMGEEDVVVLELSSFMLEGLRGSGWSPGVAVVTNVSENHLDWHGGMEEYVSAKQVILDSQVVNDAAFLGEGAERFVTNDFVVKGVLRGGGRKVEMQLPGEHNQKNGKMVLAVCDQLGVDVSKVRESIKGFGGLAHRMEFVGEVEGAKYFNDSKATTSGAAILGIEGFEKGCVHVILGGYDKGADLTGLAEVAGRWCKAVYTVGATGDAIADAAEGLDAAVVRCGDLTKAMGEIKCRVILGDVVLLSPGCASWGQFGNFEERGERFVGLVR